MSKTIWNCFLSFFSILCKQTNCDRIYTYPSARSSLHCSSFKTELDLLRSSRANFLLSSSFFLLFRLKKEMKERNCISRAFGESLVSEAASSFFTFGQPVTTFFRKKKYVNLFFPSFFFDSVVRAFLCLKSTTNSPRLIDRLLPNGRRASRLAG